MTSETIIKYDGIPSETFHYIQYVEKDGMRRGGFDKYNGFSCWAGGCGIGEVKPYKTPREAKGYIADILFRNLTMNAARLRKELYKIENCLAAIKTKHNDSVYDWLESFRVKEFKHEKKERLEE